MLKTEKSIKSPSEQIRHMIQLWQKLTQTVRGTSEHEEAKKEIINGAQTFQDWENIHRVFGKTDEELKKRSGEEMQALANNSRQWASVFFATGNPEAVKKAINALQSSYDVHRITYVVQQYRLEPIKTTHKKTVQEIMEETLVNNPNDIKESITHLLSFVEKKST